MGKTLVSEAKSKDPDVEAADTLQMKRLMFNEGIDYSMPLTPITPKFHEKSPFSWVDPLGH